MTESAERLGGKLYSRWRGSGPLPVEPAFSKDLPVVVLTVLAWSAVMFWVMLYLPLPDVLSMPVRLGALTLMFYGPLLYGLYAKRGKRLGVEDVNRPAWSGSDSIPVRLSLTVDGVTIGPIACWMTVRGEWLEFRSEECQFRLRRADFSEKGQTFGKHLPIQVALRSGKEHPQIHLRFNWGKCAEGRVSTSVWLAHARPALDFWESATPSRNESVLPRIRPRKTSHPYDRMKRWAFPTGALTTGALYGLLLLARHYDELPFSHLELLAQSAFVGFGLSLVFLGAAYQDKRNHLKLVGRIGALAGGE